MKTLAIVCALFSCLTLTGDDMDSCHPVVLEGVAKTVMRDALDIDWYRAELETPSNTVVVAVPAKTIAYSDLRRMVDAEVRIAGKMMGNPQMLYSSSQIDNESPITVLRPPPADPFEVSQVVNGIQSRHRQRVDGTVIAVRKGRVFIRSKNFHCLEAMPAEEEKMLPAVGMKISAVGFAKQASLRTLLCESLLRADGSYDPQESKAPLEIDGERLFQSNDGRNGKANLKLNGRLVRIKGVAINGYSDGADSILLKSGTRIVRVDMDFPDSSFSGNIPVGSFVEATGLCRMVFDDHPADTPIPRFQGFTIFPRSGEDVKILALPSWWTSVRLLFVIVLLAGCTIAVLIWNRMLKTLSERRGKALYREQIDHARAELKVEERTRLAVEIHDTLSQILTGVSLQIDAAMRMGKNGFAAAEQYLETARQMLASCRHELRCCIWDLRSRTFEEKDMTEAVERTVAPHTGDTNVFVRFNVPRAVFSDSTAHITLRIIRELVVNAIRHGHASHIRIAGEFRDGVIRFSVRDDGVGFDPESVQGPAHGHFGLQGIRERLGAICGNLEIESGIGTGTKVTVSFPAEKEEV